MSSRTSPIPVLCVVGTRPNFIKMAALHAVMRARASFAPVLVHTGQHYDDAMSAVFFRELGLPEPDVYLDVSGGSHTGQTARIMERMEGVIRAHAPALVIVVGDVNSTLAAAVTAVQCGVPIAHVEAGLRSRDRTMPEETNRILVDTIADLLFVTEHDGLDNLRREGIFDDRVHFVGNVMVDTLLANRDQARLQGITDRLGVAPGHYGVATMHRPANADAHEALAGILGAIAEVSRTVPVVFPLHPRTRQRIGDFGLGGLLDGEPGIMVTEPLGYLDFLGLMADARVVLTDSGGIQEETTILGVPCITMRDNTERPVTITGGTNVLAGTRRDGIVAAFRALTPNGSKGAPPLWDGRASERILDILERRFASPPK